MKPLLDVTIQTLSIKSLIFQREDWAGMTFFFSKREKQYDKKIFISFG